MSDQEIAVKAYVTSGDKFLLLKQDIAGTMYYTLPGGRVQDGGDQLELIREVKEETGLDIAVGRYLGDWHFTRPDGATTVCRTYHCQLLNDQGGQSSPESYEKIVGAEWVSKEEFLAGFYTWDESLKEFIKNYT